MCLITFVSDSEEGPNASTIPVGNPSLSLMISPPLISFGIFPPEIISSSRGLLTQFAWPSTLVRTMCLPASSGSLERSSYEEIES